MWNETSFLASLSTTVHPNEEVYLFQIIEIVNVSRTARFTFVL